MQTNHEINPVLVFTGTAWQAGMVKKPERLTFLTNLPQQQFI